MLTVPQRVILGAALLAAVVAAEAQSPVTQPTAVGAGAMPVANDDVVTPQVHGHGVSLGR